MSIPDDTPQRLLAAAGPVFAARGFEGATVRDICQRAGANLAAINYYFRDKERLYIETVKSAFACQAAETPPPAWPPGTPPAEKLRDFIRMILTKMLDVSGPVWHRQLILRELAQPTAACAELVHERIRPLAEILMGILAELLPHVSERERKLIGFSIVGQCFYHRVARPVVALLVGEEEHRQYDVETLARHISRFSLAAVGLAEPLAGGPAPRAGRRTHGKAARKA